mmetsp:Transcript_159617/g.512207  ORF Transcript_159617/g.512207 Transcript_159617/m.512207 type:complete len:326 (+) Transcript_159617:383-1360(+)
MFRLQAHGVAPIDLRGQLDRVAALLLVEVQHRGRLTVQLRHAVDAHELHSALLREVPGPERQHGVVVQLDAVAALTLVEALDFPRLPIVLLGRLEAPQHHQRADGRRVLRRRCQRSSALASSFAHTCHTWEAHAAHATHAAHAAHATHAVHAAHASEEAGHAWRQPSKHPSRHPSAAARHAAWHAARHAAAALEDDTGASHATSKHASRPSLAVFATEEHGERIIATKAGLKNIVGVLEVHAFLSAATTPGPGQLAELVVVPPLIGVVQHLVGLRDDLKVLRGLLLVVRVLVGVVPQGHLLVRLRDLVVRRRSRHPKHLVVVIRL